MSSRLVWCVSNLYKTLIPLQRLCKSRLFPILKVKSMSFLGVSFHPSGLPLDNINSIGPDQILLPILSFVLLSSLWGTQSKRSPDLRSSHRLTWYVQTRGTQEETNGEKTDKTRLTGTGTGTGVEERTHPDKNKPLSEFNPDRETETIFKQDRKRRNLIPKLSSVETPNNIIKESSEVQVYVRIGSVGSGERRYSKPSFMGLCRRSLISPRVLLPT